MNNTKELTKTLYHLKDVRHDFEIKTKQDVIEFIDYIVKTFDFQNYYPFDDDFADLVEYNQTANTTTYLFSKQLAKIYNKLTDDCYNLVGEEVYKIYDNITGGAL